MNIFRISAAVFGLCLAVFAGYGAWAGIDGPVAVEGGLVSGTSDGDLTVFKGVPFAAPPVGALRFKAPAPVVAWTGVKEASAFAPACMQKSEADPAIGAPALKVSEDCLYLNVWTPAKSAGEKLPVMVWIHGGGFTAGATSYDRYNGANLAKKGVVVVSVAYRVGSFGFLAHPALSAESPHHVSGNYGLLDQIAGLAWVNKNIAAFGGDPKRVTIFGKSAGGISVSILAASPLTKGLVQGAISESGGSFGPTLAPDIPGVRVEPLSLAEKDGVAFAGKFGAMTAADLRAIPAADIQKVDDSAPGIHCVTWDGYVIGGDQYKLYVRGQFNDIPVLIGTNSDEGAAFISHVTAEEHKKAVESGYGPFAESLLKVYPATDDAVALQSSRDLRRDTSYAWSTWVWAQLQANTGKSKVFMYYFDHKPPQAPTSHIKARGAWHGAELPFVFNNFDSDVNYDATDHAIADAVATYWTNFAKTGDPNGTGVPAWPRFTNAYPKVMHFTDKPEVGGVANLPQLQAVDAYMKWRRSQEGPTP